MPKYVGYDKDKKEKMPMPKKKHDKMMSPSKKKATSSYRVSSLA